MRRRLALAGVGVLLALGSAAAAAKAPPLRPVGVAISRPGDVTLVAVAVRIPSARAQRLRLRWQDSKRVARRVRALIAMKTERSANATTFRALAVVVTPKSRSRALYDETPDDNFDDSDHCEVWYEPAPLTLNDQIWVVGVGFGGVFSDRLFQEKKVGRWSKCGKTDCKKCKAHEARVEEAILVNLRAAGTQDLALFARAAQENWNAPLVDFSDPNLDTGHYDDGHAFGWKKGPEDIEVPLRKLDDFTKAQLDDLVREIEAALDDAKPPSPPTTTSPPKTPTPPPPAACANPSPSQQATVTLAANNVTYTFTPTTYWVASVKVGESFSFTSTVAGGAGRYQWGLGGGALPPGTGNPFANGRTPGASVTITGTPTAAGDYGFSLNVFDQGNGAGASVNYGVHVCAR